MSADPHIAGLTGPIVHDEIVPARAPWLHHIAAGQTLRIVEEGHEIGSHGDCHETPVGYARAAEAELLDRSIARLRTVLGTATVPSIAASKKVSVKIDAAADSDALKALQMWGPKPLLVTYQATQATDSQSTGSSDGSSGSDRTVDPNTKPIRLHSFLTRSSQG